ncbi:hypothetical protein ATSB10_33040 [Dyella thiooxydans]|uniref:Uncharacterized protein n=1 Tax=Dyella thiooxydans TaxID=445710 RepID=A0A160N543_9GAMM|nr:hypothetical protein ATSB10_33040 [Dyella thiooxydans]
MIRKVNQDSSQSLVVLDTASGSKQAACHVLPNLGFIQKNPMFNSLLRTIPQNLAVKFAGPIATYHVTNCNPDHTFGLKFCQTSPTYAAHVKLA